MKKQMILLSLLAMYSTTALSFSDAVINTCKKAPKVVAGIGAVYAAWKLHGLLVKYNKAVRCEAVNELVTKAKTSFDAEYRKNPDDFSESLMMNSAKISKRFNYLTTLLSDMNYNYTVEAINAERQEIVRCGVKETVPAHMKSMKITILDTPYTIECFPDSYYLNPETSR